MKGKAKDENLLNEGEENGAVKQIAEGVKNFETIHEREGYLPPGGVGDKMPPEAGGDNLGRPALAEDSLDGEIAALEAKLAQLRSKKEGGAKDTSPDGSIPVGDEGPDDKYNSSACDGESGQPGVLPNGNGRLPGKDNLAVANNGFETRAVAMDSAAIREAAISEVMARFERRDQALEDIRPLVGQLRVTAKDTGEDLYRYALSKKGVDIGKSAGFEALRGAVLAYAAGAGMDSAALVSTSKAKDSAESTNKQFSDIAGMLDKVRIA